MLKALELHGFKSFADKTRFEFPAGITVIVGPNGSGKSNIVDAIKWVLGEQSPKSLRGQDMADVIFKGSGASGRKPMNAADATLVFDNADRRLPVDAPEVHITRRVYRSGEGEYLINRQPARLKDIRDMFRGTGVGVDAYSMIEQGKVDRLLQASARDRRAIFEEAAGISRFKAKKVEAQRRLERVEQNLLRLSDIVEEVENRVKTVRAQAGKARRYREYSERLQQLRTQIALVDWRRLSEQIAQAEQELGSVTEQADALTARGERLEVRQLELETAATSAAEEIRNVDQQLAFVHQHTAQHETTIQHERKRSVEIEDEIRVHRQNLLAMSDKAGDLLARLRATQAEVQTAEVQQQSASEDLKHREVELAEIARYANEARSAADRHRQELIAHRETAAALTSHIEATNLQLAATDQHLSQLLSQISVLSANESALREQLEGLSRHEESHAATQTAHQEQLETATNELAESRNLYASRAEDLALLHGRRRGVAERAEVLEELERTFEGIGEGVKQLLEKAREQGTGDRGQGTEHSDSPWSLVRGVVADFIQVAVQHATAIDVALGDYAQAVVIHGTTKDAANLTSAGDDLAGRAVAIADDPLPAESTVAELTPEMVSGVQVIARADKLVECADAYRPLVKRLLGRTFVIASLQDALVLRLRAPQGCLFVTLAGELVDEHGAIAFGPRQAATRLVSRRSQLRAARLDLAVLDQQIADATRETAHLKKEIEQHEETLRRLQEAGRAIDDQAAAYRALRHSISQRLEQVDHQTSSSRSSHAEAQSRWQALQTAIEQAQRRLSGAQTAAESARLQLAEYDRTLQSLESKRQAGADQVTAAKIELARRQQALESLRLRLTQFQDDSRERERALSQVRNQLGQSQHRVELSSLAILAASAEIADLAIRQQAFSRQLELSTASRDHAVAERSGVADELATVHRQARALRDQQHQLDLAAEQIRHQRQTLADRLREDYGIDLAALEHEPSPEEAQERVAVEAEIDSLRRKINQIGAVNLDALDELDDLEQRFATLSGQHKDLTEAKQSLERIIHKINADSRRLFLETLEAIRVNFQALYRRAFGGGKADIVLEEGVDVLDCGVEIIATPPGKPSFNNSLLSGGEKALTAVALLLAIFQFRPSPFCVLDEVDAPFDEANIGRFIDVLHDFLGWTRFVIVTHSKKTMTSATTLYGVTMQESGVSKRVSVRFDDVTEDGHIRQAALDRTSEATEDAA
jgi:chromosome segregation protein